MIDYVSDGPCCVRLPLKNRQKRSINGHCSVGYRASRAGKTEAVGYVELDTRGQASSLPRADLALPLYEWPRTQLCPP